jgi:hypothetical protein
LRRFLTPCGPFLKARTLVRTIRIDLENKNRENYNKICSVLHYYFTKVNNAPFCELKYLRK